MEKNSTDEDAGFLSNIRIVTMIKLWSEGSGNSKSFFSDNDPFSVFSFPFELLMTLVSIGLFFYGYNTENDNLMVFGFAAAIGIFRLIIPLFAVAHFIAFLVPVLINIGWFS